MALSPRCHKEKSGPWNNLSDDSPIPLGSNQHPQYSPDSAFFLELLVAVSVTPGRDTKER